MKFTLDKEKAIEALVYIAGHMPSVGRFHAAKILYFAEREHLRNYGRPIVGDRYIAMDNGPVPSFAYDVLKGALPQKDKVIVKDSIVETKDKTHPTYEAVREANLDYFSRTDLRCLDWAIDHCKGRTFGEISDETHKHLAWKNVAPNATMQFSDFFDGVDEEIVDYARAFASHGVL